MSCDERLVSIVLPTFNGSRYLREAIDSSLGQTYDNIELIVVDDGSTDKTADILREYTDPRMAVLRHKRNRGLPEGLNTGFAHSAGTYLTWTSDDNRYAADAIATMVDCLETHPEVDLVCAPYWEIDERGEILRLNHPKPVDRIMEYNTVGACFLYRRQVYAAIGQYNPDVRLVEDYEYWLRVAERFKMTQLDEPLYYYRLHGNSLTSQHRVVHERWRLAARLKRQRFGLSWRHYWLQMARIDIDEAFACYRDGDYDRVPGLALRGLARNPLWLLNLGISSITVRSLMKRRGAWSTPGKDCSEEAR